MIQPRLETAAAPMRAVRWMLAAGLAAAAHGGPALAADEPAAAPPPAAAQSQPPGARPDFLFGQPRGVIGVSGGLLRASGGGVLDWFRGYLISGVDDAGNKIPIGARAYDTTIFRYTAGFSASPRVDVLFEVAPSDSLVPSEYSEFTEGGRPITQTTQMRQVPLNVSVRYWMLPRGRRIGRLAWVPHTLALNVGAGIGGRWYRIEQVGDFVDTANNSIHRDRLRSQGWAMTRHVSAGLSVRMTRRLFAVAEARQVWSRARADHVFNFGDIDLNGLQMTGGIEFVF